MMLKLATAVYFKLLQILILNNQNKVLAYLFKGAKFQESAA